MSFLTKREIDKRINIFFAHVEERLGKSYTGLTDRLGIDSKLKPSALPLNDLFILLNEMNVTLDTIISGRVDLSIIEDHLNGHDSLPEKYVSKVPFSSRFTGIYMFDYIEKNFGRRSADLSMQHLQLKNSQFTDQTLKNNILLPLDIANYVYTYHGADHVEAMGRNFMARFKESHYGKYLATFSDVAAMMETFLMEIAPLSVEKNFSWDVFSQGSDTIYITGKPNEEVLDAFGEKKMSSSALEVLRKGFFASAISLSKKHEGICVQLQSMANGDQFDLYEVKYRPSGQIEVFLS